MALILAPEVTVPALFGRPSRRPLSWPNPASRAPGDGVAWSRPTARGAAMTGEAAATAREGEPADGRRTKASTIDVAGLDGGLVRLTAEQLDELDRRGGGAVAPAGGAGWGEGGVVWGGVG